MDFSEIFALYHTDPPESHEVIDSGHGETDLRLALVCAWPEGKLVIKVADNGFTDELRVTAWRDTIEAYRALGYDCPRIVDGRDGKCARRVPFRGRDCLVYAEEFARGRITGRDQQADRQAWFTWREDAIELLARVGAARLDTAPFPSGCAILEPFAPDEQWDEVMENALEFQAIIAEQYPQFSGEFAEIWRRYLQNKAELEALYPALPRSVFQADLNPTNLLLDEQDRLQGVFDFNLAGRDTVINAMMREFLADFYEDVLDDPAFRGPYYKTFLEEDIHALATRSLLDNFRLAARYYAFTEEEKRAARLIYRYLRPFWWQPLNCLQRAGDDTDLVARLLAWIAREQQAEYDLAGAMT